MLGGKRIEGKFNILMQLYRLITTLKRDNYITRDIDVIIYRARLEQPAHKDIKVSKAFQVLKDCQDQKDIKVIPALKVHVVLKATEEKWGCPGFRVLMVFTDYLGLQDQKDLLV